MHHERAIKRKKTTERIINDSPHTISWQSGTVENAKDSLPCIKQYRFRNGVALTQNRLLIVSVSNAARQSKDTAMIRNRWVCETADRILFVGVTEQSSLYALKAAFNNKQKMITL